MSKPILDQGHVGQVVVLYGADFSEIPERDKYPLSKYPQPSIFTITARGGSKDSFYYALNDGTGKMITLWNTFGVPGVNRLYDADEWLTEREVEMKGECAYRDEKIRLLERVIETFTLLIDRFLRAL